MADETAITDESVAEAPAPDGKRRERSTIEFPYGDLDDALSVATAIHKNAGVECTIDQLAAFLGYSSVGGGAFRLKLATARTFGLIEAEKQQYALTELGRKIVDSRQERRARADAFLRVPLYKEIYDRYRGHLLPPDIGLEREMASLGVSEKQTDKARQAFRRSADQAGFFEQGKDRLVPPTGVATRPIEGDASSMPEPQQEREQSGNGGGSGKEPPDLDPLIAGLVKRLPKSDSEWPMAEREHWLETARHIFAIVYTEPTKPSEPSEALPVAVQASAVVTEPISPP